MKRGPWFVIALMGVPLLAMWHDPGLDARGDEGHEDFAIN